jgi:hypothetical protein
VRVTLVVSSDWYWVGCGGTPWPILNQSCHRNVSLVSPPRIEPLTRPPPLSPSQCFEQPRLLIVVRTELSNRQRAKIDHYRRTTGRPPQPGDLRVLEIIAQTLERVRHAGSAPEAVPDTPGSGRGRSVYGLVNESEDDDDNEDQDPGREEAKGDAAPSKGQASGQGESQEEGRRQASSGAPSVV